jgi:hypothetical protein
LTNCASAGEPAGTSHTRSRCICNRSVVCVRCRRSFMQAEKTIAPALGSPDPHDGVWPECHCADEVPAWLASMSLC